MVITHKACDRLNHALDVILSRLRQRVDPAGKLKRAR